MKSRRWLWQQPWDNHVSFFQGGVEGSQDQLVTKGMESLFLCYFLHTVVRAGRAAPLSLQERNRPRQRKSSGLQGMSEMPKDSACLWNIGLFYQMTCWGCHMACAWHSVQDNRAWVHAGLCPRGRDDRSRACLVWFYWLMEPQLSVASTVPFQAGFQRTWLPPRLRVGCCDSWSQSGWASTESDVMRVQWTMFIITANNNRYSLHTKELMSSWFICCKPPHQRFPGDVII